MRIVAKGLVCELLENRKNFAVFLEEKAQEVNHVVEILLQEIPLHLELESCDGSAVFRNRPSLFSELI